jgi:hypothetical protein
VAKGAVLHDMGLGFRGPTLYASDQG